MISKIEKTIYHGSKDVIRVPQYGMGNPYNDYGLGFYTTIDKGLASSVSSTCISVLLFC